MSKKITATMKVPRTQSTEWASNPIKAQEAISVTMYADGTLRAVHNRLDLFNRRIIPTSLGDEHTVPGEPPCMGHLLEEAARGWHDALHLQGELF